MPQGDTTNVPIFFKIPTTDSNARVAVDLVTKALRLEGLEFEVSDGVLTTKDLQALYGHIAGAFFISITAQLAGQRLPMLNVLGPADSIVEHIQKLKGEQTNPFACEPNTWRYKLGQILGHAYCEVPLIEITTGRDIATTIRNVIHSPNRKELRANQKVLDRFFKKKA